MLSVSPGIEEDFWSTPPSNIVNNYVILKNPIAVHSALVLFLLPTGNDRKKCPG